MLAAGFYNRTNLDEIRELITEAGFNPAQRTTKYEIIDPHVGRRAASQSATAAATV